MGFSLFFGPIFSIKHAIKCQHDIFCEFFHVNQVIGLHAKSHKNKSEGLKGGEISVLVLIFSMIFNEECIGMLRISAGAAKLWRNIS